MIRVPVLQLVSITVIFTGLVAAVMLCNSLIDQERAEIRRVTATEVRHIAAGLRAGLSENFEHLERFGRWWLSQKKPFDPEEWRSDGQLFLSRSAGLRRTTWIGPDGIQQWSIENESEPVFEAAEPGAVEAVLIRTARSMRGAAISELFRAPGVPEAFYACVPIYLHGALQGYVVGLYDASSLISAQAASVVRPDEYISVRSGGREIHVRSSETVPRGIGVPEEQATAQMELPNQVWTVVLRVPLSYFRHFRRSMFTMIMVLGALIYSLSMLMYLSHRKSSILEQANAALKSEVARREQIESEVRELNKELNRKVADFEALLEVIPVGIAVAHDKACERVSVNPALADMMGLPKALQAMTGEGGAAEPPCRVFRDGRELEADDLPMRMAALSGRKSFAEELQIVRADHTTVDVLSFASPLFDESGQVRGVINAIVDVSARKHEERMRHELERRLHDAQRFKSLGVMAGGIAHSFNNLLTSVIGQASLAMDTLHDPAEAESHLSASIRSAEQAAELIHEVLAYTGRAFHTLRPLDLAEVIGAMRPILAGVAGSRRIDIRFDVDGVLPRVKVAADQFQHALKHLVVNAVEATGTGATITVGVNACDLSGKEPGLMPPDYRVGPGRYVRVEVKDTGPGMPAEVAEKAFDPFFSTKFQGRGLGLSVVLGIMRAHKGAVRIASAQNSGTSVELFFPAEPYAENKRGSGTEAQSVAAGGSRVA